MKIGDIVECQAAFRDQPQAKGLIVGFNKKGEGGKEFVHVLIDDKIEVFMYFEIRVIEKKENSGKN